MWEGGGGRGEVGRIGATGQKVQVRGCRFGATGSGLHVGASKARGYRFRDYRFRDYRLGATGTGATGLRLQI